MRMACEQEQRLLAAHAAAERIDATLVDVQPRQRQVRDHRHPGEVLDLAGGPPRVPVIAHLTLQWLHIDQRRVYALGGSMGGQETLLLLARHPHLLAGAAAFDSVTNMALQYRSFLRLPCSHACRRAWHGPIGRALQSLARQE